MQRPLLVVSLFALSLSAQGWVDRTPSNPLAAPAPRRGAAMCWDAAHNYMLMVGGYVGQGLGADSWSWNGSSWVPVGAPLAPVVQVIPGIQDGAMAFHPPTNEVVLVWQSLYYTWTGSNWLQRGQLPNQQNGVPANVSIGRDTVRGETVLFVGGRYMSLVISPAAETYVWDGFAWSPRATSTRPGPSGLTSMAFDPVAGRLLLQITSSTLSTYWEWTGTNWLQRFYPGAPVRGGAMATDPSANRIVMFDGVLDGQPNHTWTIGGASMQLRGSPTNPAQRSEAAMAYDPVRGKVVMFGGFNGLELGDTWEFTVGADASYGTFGTGCLGTRGVPSLAAQTGSLPRIGQTFSLQIGNLPFQSSVFLFLGFSNTDFSGTPLPFSLAPFGAPCTVFSSGDQSYLLPNLLGTSVWNVNVPNVPGVQFYNQAFVFDAAANTFGVTASNAGHGVVGM